MTRLISWFFAERKGPATTWRIILWWEARRIPFNLVIGAYGLLCLAVFYWAIGASGQLEPGEDAVEPIAIILAPLAINALYTLGWLVEVPAQRLAQEPHGDLGPTLLGAGTTVGMGLITLPAAYWLGYRLLSSWDSLEHSGSGQSRRRIICGGSDGAAEQGVEADEAEHNGASQLNSSVGQTSRVARWW